MNFSNGPLDFDAVIRDSQFLATIQRMEQRVVGIATTSVREVNKVDSQIKRLGQVAAGYFAFDSLKSLPADILKVRGEFQQLEIAFTTILKSKDKADALMSGLIEDAASTPFGLKDLAAGSKQLLAYGSNAESVRGELRMLGDVASGVSVPIGELIYLYGTLRSQGRAYSVDIRQFAGRGIPIYAELAKVLGVGVDKVNSLVEAGKVGFPQVEQAFKNMTSQGGMFAGLMEAQSTSLLGLKERLNDAYEVMLNDIGKQNQGLIAEVINGTTFLVENYKSVVDILIVAAGAYGTYKAAILAVSAATKAQAFLNESVALEMAFAKAAGEALTLQEARQIVVKKLLARAQLELNAAMAVNPYVLVATAIAALTTAYFVFREEALEVKSGQELMTEAFKSVGSQVKVQGQEVKTLTGVLQNNAIAESERLKAYEKLKSISPDIVGGLTFQQAKTADLTKATNEYLVALEKKIRLEAASASLKTALEQDADAAERLKKAQDNVVKQSGLAKGPNVDMGMGQYSGNIALRNMSVAQDQLNKAAEDRKKTEKAVADINKTITGIYTGGSKEAVNAEIGRLEKVQSTIKDKLSPAYKQAEDDLIKLRKQREALTAAENKGTAAVVKNKAYYDDQIKQLKEKQEQEADSPREYKAYQKQIDAMIKQRNRLTGELTKDEKKAVKEADKKGPFGSVQYWEYIAQKADEVLQKTPTTDTAKIAQLNAQKIDAERRAEEARKKITIRTFEEELDEKKNLYTLYNRWVETYGAESANAQFDKLRGQGQSYIDYLNTQIERLESDRENVGLTDKQAGNLSTLLAERDEATGKKSPIEKFNEELQQAQQEAASLTDYLEMLRAKQASLNPTDNSPNNTAKRLAVAEQITQAENERQAQLRTFLDQFEGSQQQQLVIQKKYGDLRAALDKKFADDRGEAYQSALGQIDEAENRETREVAERATQASAAFKKLDEVVMERGRAALRKRLQNLNEYLQKEAQAINTQAYQAKLKERNDTQIQLDQADISDLNTYANLSAQLGEAIGQMNGNLGQAGRLMNGLASQASLVTIAFDANAEQTEKMAAGVQGIIGLVDILISSANERKQAELEYYRSVTAQQQQYNIALNDQLGLQTELSESVFVKNFEGRLKDGVTKMNAANKGLTEAMDKLAGGKAKIGQNNAVDWNKVGKGAGLGAATGAAVGSIVPVIGTAIGAAVGAGVGALTGLFGGKKKKDEFGSLLQAYPQLIQTTKDGVEELNVELAKTLVANNLVDESTKLVLEETIAWTEQIKEAKEQIRGVISELAGSLGNTLRDNLVTAFEEGTDAAKAFGDSVSDVLEDILSQLIFNQVFSDEFEKLQKEMEDSYGAGGDGSWVDDFGRFFGKADELTKLFNNGLEAAQGAASQFGLNVFSKNPAQQNKNTTALSGAVKGVSEETASVLAGQINAIRIDMAATGQVVRQQLIHLAQIASFSRYLTHLESIDNKLDALDKDPLRPRGL